MKKYIYLIITIIPICLQYKYKVKPSMNNLIIKKYIIDSLYELHHFIITY